MYAIFYEVWGMCDREEISTITAHRMLGRYFGYPECCIEAFIKDYPDQNRSSNGQIGSIYGLEERFWCWDCLRERGIQCEEVM